MIITKIVKDNKKYRIYSDDQFLFSLYYTEIKKYELYEEGEIGNEIIERIGNEVVVKRGTTYVYHLISKKDYTSQEILRKLTKSGYTEAHANRILQIVTDQGFINDEDYTKRYLEQQHTKKSKKQLMYNLQGKGIDSDTMQAIFEEYPLDEYEAAKNLIQKKLKNKVELTFEEQGKLYHFMLNKGFKSSTIKKALDEVMELFREL